MTAPEAHLLAKKRLLQLLRQLSYKSGEVVLASGQVSDFYVDCRQTALHAEGADLIGRLVLEQIESLRAAGNPIVGVGGMTLGADPIAAATAVVSQRQGVPVHAFIVRKEAKDHGTGSQIEGLANLPEGSQVLVVEDTVTTGGSSLRAVEAIKAAGLVPAGLFCLVDRLEGGRQRIEAAGLTYTSLFTRDDLVG